MNAVPVDKKTLYAAISRGAKNKGMQRHEAFPYVTMTENASAASMHRGQIAERYIEAYLVDARNDVLLIGQERTDTRAPITATDFMLVIQAVGANLSALSHDH
ncbi:hypothetical protein ACIOZM_26380 [Pseudomonas sp. NPDC087346]|uniref:hypothetical protein n=1 Tax=Pseudomonas sp. NPDC087346 TaxID=3364438 RepID=UPI003802C866